MNFCVFGLSVSSSWGNGHAVLWRGLIAALLRAGHHVTFFERDVPYYAQNRDLWSLPPGGELTFYQAWHDILPTARTALARADVAIVTSYCPDGIAATAAIHDSRVAVSCFYDLDTPVTLARVEAGEAIDYIGPDGLRGFDLVLSYTGGGAIDALKRRLGARRVVPLYGWVDPNAYRPGVASSKDRALLSYLGTYAADRQPTLEALFVEPARALPDARFVIGGAQYPDGFPWTNNVFFVHHVPPSEHPSFYASSRMTLNVTRAAMARSGWCPSGRLFEAAACGVPILTDWWEGLDEFFVPDEEIAVAHTTADALAILADPPTDFAARARARVLDEHTAERRVASLVAAVEQAARAEV